jgi:hypothetical protein
MSDETFTIAPERRFIFAIGGDGHVELGPGVTLDEASAAFWKQVNARGLADRAALVDRVVEACAKEAERADAEHDAQIEGWPTRMGKPLPSDAANAIRAIDRKKLLEGT